MAALIEAVIIMSQSRSMAAFAIIMGINPEPLAGNDKPSSAPTDVYEPKSDENKTAEVLNKLKQTIWKPGQKKSSIPNSLEQFAASVTPPDKNHNKEEGSSDQPSEWDWLQLSVKYEDPYSKLLSYEDFDTNSKEYTILQDFSWNNQGFSLLKQFNNRSAKLLDNCFNCIRSLTYKSFHHQKAVDTESFRMAIWYYVHRLYGLFHDDINYGLVTDLLSSSIRNFVKKAAVNPSTITSKDFRLGIPLLPEEIAHIALLVCEARKQAEFIYALRAISLYSMSENKI